MKTKTWNQQIVKRENKRIVLNTIKKKSPISRARIANMTGLNKGTVSSLVSELIDEDLIYESGPGESSGGRRPVMLLFNKTAGYSIGINLDVNYILGVLTDLDGNVILEEAITLNETHFPVVKEKLFKIIELLINSAPQSTYGIIGVGVGVPGIVNNRGMLLLAPNLNWKSVDLIDIIEQKFDLPVTIENEANAGAFGEMKFGLGADANNIIYVSVGIGIGVGLILNGGLFKGYNGFSGELGHMTIKDDGEGCGCGNVGCWELYASEKALINNAKKVIVNQENNDKISLDDLILLAKNENKQSIKLFEKIGDDLGTGINNIINIFNPEQIIIGNRMVFAKDWIVESITNRIENERIGFQHQNLKLDFSELNVYSPAIGMAAFSIERFFSEFQSVHS
ncbi:ROK family transcriptional regulator [Oceanobacillus alkalisoli]|uniref:ROK family transcriptional regulator n=1 Tax=Oceanobacillus alkalisoli TaxID=2925113 RepID=UPI001F11C462|nr:ROK family transcriptional regulator [Oceanobacillus alkalisoli]MCF3942797.1 ROK family transcriptional regulator [Oceanobacillus alkalisoli]